MGSLIRSFVVHRGWWLALWALYAVVTTILLQAALTEIRQHNIDLATTGARNVFRTLVTMRQWNAERGGVYVPIGVNTQPNPHLKHPRRDIHTVAGSVYYGHLAVKEFCDFLCLVVFAFYLMAEIRSFQFS